MGVKVKEYTFFTKDRSPTPKNPTLTFTLIQTHLYFLSKSQKIIQKEAKKVKAKNVSDSMKAVLAGTTAAVGDWYIRAGVYSSEKLNSLTQTYINSKTDNTALTEVLPVNKEQLDSIVSQFDGQLNGFPETFEQFVYGINEGMQFGTRLVESFSAGLAAAALTGLFLYAKSLPNKYESNR
ncbi:hypothetical protein GOV05_01090 [Candidatus Woesearchaeota archaeon]|nr:hypothetical protein [Candidatus Woesearchaeota archaeon]